MFYRPFDRSMGLWIIIIIIIMDELLWIIIISTKVFADLMLKEGFTVLRMAMNQNTFWPLLAMTQSCLI